VSPYDFGIELRHSLMHEVSDWAQLVPKFLSIFLALEGKSVPGF
jgi:hypothetical protein